MRTKTYLTIEQLEGMKTHELADLLGNIALLLRRMPDVLCGELIQPIPSDDVFMAAKVPQRVSTTSHFTEAELRKKKVAELKKIANDSFIAFPGNIKKDDLISKILTRVISGRSEQFAIQDV